MALKKNDSGGRGGSPAINKGVKPSDPAFWYDKNNFTTDQRGAQAPLGGLFDLGAYQAQ